MDDPKIFNPYQPKRRRNHALSEDVWDMHRQQIEKLYLGLNMTLQDVAREMKQHGLEASVRQYTHTFDRWRITKNVPAKVKRHAARKLYRNPLMNEPTFHQGGHFEHICRPVDVARFQRDNPEFDPSTSPTCTTPSVLDWASDGSKASTPVGPEQQQTVGSMLKATLPAHSHPRHQSIEQGDPDELTSMIANHTGPVPFNNLGSSSGHDCDVATPDPATRISSNHQQSPPIPEPDLACHQETTMIFAALAVGWGWDVIHDLSILRDTTNALSSLTLAEGSDLSKHTRAPALKHGLSPTSAAQPHHDTPLSTVYQFNSPPVALQHPGTSAAGAIPIIFTSTGPPDNDADHPTTASAPQDLTTGIPTPPVRSPSTPDTVSYGPFTFQDRGWNLAPACHFCFARLDWHSLAPWPGTCSDCAKPPPLQAV